jgi:hypothetical protein
MGDLAENPPLSSVVTNPTAIVTAITASIARITAPTFSVNFRQPQAIASGAENPCADDGGAGGGGGGGGGGGELLGPPGASGGGGTEP